MYVRSKLQSVARRAVMNNVPKRNMGGGGGPPPEYEGIDKVVRGVFPKDNQLALAIIGGYFGLYLVSKIASMGGKKKPAEVVAPKSGTSDGSIPSIDSPEFDSWIGTDGNLEKLIASASTE